MVKGSGYYDQQRLLGRPKANVDVVCVHCQSNQVKARSTRRIETAPDYFWRNYTCKICGASFWIGVSFSPTNEVVYASTPPTLESFYRMCILFSHEDVLAGRWCPSIVPYGYGSISASFYNTRETARNLAEHAMKDWEKANQRAVQDLTPQQRNVLFAKTYSLYMEVVTKFDYSKQEQKGGLYYGRITPITEEERVKLETDLRRLDDLMATSEVATPKQQENENGHEHAE